MRLIKPLCYYILLLAASLTHAALSDHVENLDKTPGKLANYLKDSQITAEVKSRLLKKLGSDVADVVISTRQGRVMLTGFIPSQRPRSQLTKLAKAVSGVNQVDNQLQPLANQPATLKGFTRDTLITSDIKARLFSDSTLDSNSIKVTTRNGEVFLSGIVTAKEKEKLTELVRKSMSAQVIHNHVKIKK